MKSVKEEMYVIPSKNLDPKDLYVQAPIYNCISNMFAIYSFRALAMFLHSIREIIR